MNSLVYTNDRYDTTPGQPSLGARLFPSFLFYSRFMTIVWKASAKSKRNTYTSSDWCDSCLEILHALEKSGIRISLSGIEYLRELDSPCVVIANHMSTLETVILPCIILPFREVTYIVKQSLLEYPIFKHVMRNCNPVGVGRTNPREDLKAVLHGGVERLNQGTSMIVFPQTTRTHHFDPDQFNSIGIKLALKAKVPVLPLALKTDAWGNGKRLKDFGKMDGSKPVRLAFGEPIPVTDRGKEAHQAVVDFISGQLSQWQQKTVASD
jgi:1-acyl-sn-glycerol-3-phosphate acyltransferase